MNSAITPTNGRLNQFIRAIDLDDRLATTTTHQYKREIEKAFDAGVNLLDPQQVQAYALTLPKSSRAFLKSAIRKLSKQIELDLKSGATPDNAQTVQASLYRIEALNEAIKVKASKGQKAAVWLTTKEVKTLMSKIDGRFADRDRVLIGLLVGAGLRRFEAVNLTYGDMVKQGDRMTLSITGKGAKNRVVPISPALEKRIIDYRPGQASADSKIVEMHTSQVFKIVRKYGRLIDKPKLAPHDLRRTFAQIAYENGVPIVQISKILGHSNVAVTQRYLNTEIDLKVSPSDFVPV